MNNAPAPAYERLPGTGRRLTSRSTLWLGPDHLLRVTNIGYTQEYKRFYLADIQAILIRRTETGKAWNGVWAGLTLLFAALTLQSRPDVVMVPLVPGGLFLLCLLVNLGMGPTCASHIRTAVQTEALPSLSRLRNAHQVTAQLSPLIAAAQSAPASRQPGPDSEPSTGSSASF